MTQVPPGDDPEALLAELIQRRSVTPADDGALALVATQLEALGFTVTRLTFQAEGTTPIGNLYARLGTARPNFCFAGHTDVVPPGDTAQWQHPPFAGTTAEACLWGRGAVDMKGGVAAFLAALARVLRTSGGQPPAGSISLLITGDEEGPGTNGTQAVLQWLAEQGETIDYCLVGEPTNPETLGEAIKIGRRGSLNGTITAHGMQGHTAYPHNADNPLPRLAKVAWALATLELDRGTDHFDPSTLALTAFETGNDAPNVIPAAGLARFNVRFNDAHTPDMLQETIRRTAEQANLDAGGGDLAIDFQLSGEAFVTDPGPLSFALSQAIAAETGRTPALSTAGGTSDARFIRHYCPVVEFGLVGQTMHKVDERVALADLHRLTAIYERLLKSPPAG